MSNELNNQPVRSGNVVGSDGKVYNLVDLLLNVTTQLEEKLAEI